MERETKETTSICTKSLISQSSATKSKIKIIIMLFSVEMFLTPCTGAKGPYYHGREDFELDKDLCKEGHYCNEKLLDVNHTMCVLDAMPNAADCAREWLLSGITAQMQLYITYFHNSRRNTVASGLELSGKPGPQPPASQMNYLIWDYELQTLAQRWVNQCYVEGVASNSNTDRFKVAQLVNIIEDPAKNPVLSWNQTLHKWYHEVEQFSRFKLTTYSAADNVNTSSYTQIVWDKTMNIGCGYNRYRSFGVTADVLACNYGPAGNIEGQTIYSIGRPCSQCEMACSFKFNGLCDSPY